MRFEAFDKDVLKDDFIGYHEFDVKEWLQSGKNASKRLVAPLMNKKNVFVGELYLEYKIS